MKNVKIKNLVMPDGFYPMVEHGGSMCYSESGVGFGCTRVSGHEGPHAAHSAPHLQHCTWEDGEEEGIILGGMGHETIDR